MFLRTVRRLFNRRSINVMSNPTEKSEYQQKLEAESRKWGDHLRIEASGEWHAWLDHPLIAEHYRQRALIEGVSWEQWLKRHWGRPAERSLELGCGAGSRSIILHQSGVTNYVEGYDVSDERIAEGERQRTALGIAGSFQVADINPLILPPDRYDLIFSCHSFHHFLELEHIMAQVNQALTADGLFVLEEFVGPTQFQWTDRQIAVVRSLLGLMPAALRTFRWDAVKEWEGRPTPAEVVAVSPFESIRSADIFPLFQQHFDIVTIKRLGGTLQHLLYNGIAHNFHPGIPDAARYVEGVYTTEDALIDSEMLPSDFMLLVGRRKDTHA